MPIRMTGLVSGLDTEALVKELMSVQSMKMTKKENLKTKTEWKQEKWKDLNTKIYSLYTGKLTKMKMQGNYSTKKVSSSDDSVATATASSSAAMGSHSLEVKSLASAQYVTGAKITEDNLKSDASAKKVTAKSKLTDFNGIEEGTVITIKNKAGSTKTLEIKENTKISDFVSACQDAGLNASFDENQGRFFLSSKQSGAEQGFEITSGDSSEETVKTSAALNKLKKDIYELIDYENLDTAAQTMMDDYFEKMNITDSLSKMKKAKKEYEDYQETYDKMSEEEKTAAAEKLAEYKDVYEKANQIYEEEKEAQTKDLNELISVSQDFAIVNTDFTVEQINQKLNDIENNFLEARDNDSTVSTGVLASLGLGEITGEEIEGGAGSATVRAAKGAVFILDGAEMTATENTVTVNGLTLDLKGVTNGAISLNVVTNVDDIYNAFKDFIKEYNEVLKEMNDAYGAESARKYDVLTSEQKEAMTDEEVEKWEGKIKDSLLRRDSILGSLVSAMKTTMHSSVKLDSVTYEVIDTTKKDANGDYKQYNAPVTYSLASFGIQTSSDYTEGGLLHIYGDEDDELYSAEDNKLKKALEENPAAVQSVLSKICSNLYDTLTEKMASSSISSAMTFYNDKELKSQISTYEDDLKALQKKLNEQEDRYFKQFTAMEKAMSQAQSQSNSLGGLLGTNG